MQGRHLVSCFAGRLLRDYAASASDVLSAYPQLRIPVYERSRSALQPEAGDPDAKIIDYRIGIVINHMEQRRSPCSEPPLGGEPRDVPPRGRSDRRAAETLGDLGLLELWAGNRERGLEMIEASIAMARESGWLWWETQKLVNLAAAAIEEADADEAERRARAVLPLALRMGHSQYELFALAVLARAAALRGNAERALALWATVEMTEDAPGRFGRFDRATSAAMPEGPRPEPLPLDQAVALALAG